MRQITRFTFFDLSIYQQKTIKLEEDTRNKK